MESMKATAGQRGPVEHERRQEILAAADEHFRRYGYHKTTVADLAKAVGLSSAYIYKFFESKQAIGEAVCSQCLGRIQTELQSISAEKKSAADRMRDIYKVLASMGVKIFLEERKLHEIVLAAVMEDWQVGKDHNVALLNIIRQVVIEGREAGEFERKTPLDETCRAILLTIQPFSHPILVQQNHDHIAEEATTVANLVLRSLSI